MNSSQFSSVTNIWLKLARNNFYIIICILVEHDHDDSTQTLEKLENIDSETDNLDITFVKMADTRYARKWGVTKIPALVYFRKKFPSIYRGLLIKFDMFKNICITNIL